MTLKGADFPAGCPVGIDFTQPDAVLTNATAALKAGARYVIGTTGWDAQLPDLKKRVAETKGGVVYAANFSLGVNLFYKVVRDAAQLLARFPDYDPYILEKHHRQKKDAPSGTLLKCSPITSRRLPTCSSSSLARPSASLGLTLIT